MIYLLYGPNSYKALNKIGEFKSAFLKKGSADFLIEEIDFAGARAQGVKEISFADLGQSPLFSARRLLILKNALSEKSFSELVRAKISFLKNSPDVFIFWESEPDEKGGVFKLLEKNAEKAQAVESASQKELDGWLAKKAGEMGVKLAKKDRDILLSEIGDGGEWALENELEKFVLAGDPADANCRRGTGNSQTQSHTSPFPFVEKIFSSYSKDKLLVLKQAVSAGHVPEKLIYPLLWKARQKQMRGVYKKGILAESAMRRDPKSAYEHLERFVLAVGKP